MQQKKSSFKQMELEQVFIFMSKLNRTWIGVTEIKLLSYLITMEETLCIKITLIFWKLALRQASEVAQLVVRGHIEH